MKQERYSLWPEDPAVGRRRSEAKLVAISFVAGIGFMALSPFALSYVGRWIEPMRMATLEVDEVNLPSAPASAVAAQFAALSQRVKKYVAVEYAAPSAREAAEAAKDSERGAPRARVAEVPLPIPRPPDIEEVSKAMTAFARLGEGLVPNESGLPTKLAGEAAPKPAAETPPRPRTDPTPAKVKPADASAARQSAHRTRLPWFKRNMTIYHLPDGRQLRVYGRLSGDDARAF